MYTRLATNLRSYSALLSSRIPLPNSTRALSTLSSSSSSSSSYPHSCPSSTASRLCPWAFPVLLRVAHYHKNVLDHYNRPRNVGSLDKNDPNVGTGLVGAPACGDVMKLQIRVDDQGKIVETKFKTFGCGSAIASSSFATEYIQGKTIEEAVLVKNSDIAKELKLPPVKLHCSMLAEDAIKAAVRDIQRKKQVASAETAAQATA